MAPIRCCLDQTAVWHSDAARGPSTPSFDHLVGASEEHWRHVEAEDFGGRQIDDEVEFGRLLHREIGRLRAAQNLIDIVRRSSEKVREIWSIGHQASYLDVLAR